VENNSTGSEVQVGGMVGSRAAGCEIQVGGSTTVPVVQVEVANGLFLLELPQQCVALLLLLTLETRVVLFLGLLAVRPAAAPPAAAAAGARTARPHPTRTASLSFTAACL